MENPFSDSYIEELAHKFKNGRLTATEKEEFEQWYNQFDDTEFVHSGAAEPGIVKDRIGHQLLKKIQEETRQGNTAGLHSQPHLTRRLPVFRRAQMAVAASLLVFLSLGIFFVLTRHRTPVTNYTAIDKIIRPGANKARLTLGNGMQISLTDAKNGQLAMQSGISVIKTADGKMIYQGDNQEVNKTLLYNTIETPRGGQYQVILSDGTKVWLNAASSLKYPTSFNSLKERKVILSGEAYFEVVHNKTQPFRVVSGSQLVEDIGTSFNINDYTDDPVAKTTVIEGAASVASLNESQLTQQSQPSSGDPKQVAATENVIGTKILTPGQQAVLNKTGGLSIRNADLQEVVAWKNGDFVFRSTDFRTVMRNIARWYDVDVIYDPSAPSDVPLGGLVSRSKNISVLLNLMEETGAVHFKIEGRKITIRK